MKTSPLRPPPLLLLFLCLTPMACAKLSLVGKACTSERPCPEGLVCLADLRRGASAGTCNPLSCTTTADCAPNTLCVAGRCAPSCRNTTDCPGTALCVDGACRAKPCVPGPGCANCPEECDAALGCTDGVCNICQPNSRSCVGGNRLATCNALGTAIDQQLCGDGGCGSVCQAGECVAGTAPQGTSCQGQDSNFCTSSCDAGGVCVNVAVNCDDDNICTADSCASTSGCIYDVTPFVGTACGFGNRCAASCSSIGVCRGDQSVDCSGAGVCAVCTPSTGECVPGKLDEECRAAVAGGCDVAELCDGDLECPVDEFMDAGDVCLTAQAGALCDLADVCDGVSAACVARYRPSDYMCGEGAAATDPQEGCDVAEFCTNDSPDCPADIVHVNGEQCQSGTCDTAGAYSSSGCSAAGECVETTDMCGVCADEPAAACSVSMGCVSSIPRDCSGTCTGCTGATSQPTCDPATDTCSVGIPSECSMKLTELSKTQIKVNIGCSGQIVTCQAIGRFHIVKDAVLNTEFNEFNGTVDPPTFGWQAAKPVVCGKISGCPESDRFAGLASLDNGAGTFSFIADVSGFTKIEHFFHAGEKAEPTPVVEMLSLRYCCGDECTTEGDSLWSLAGTDTGANWGFVQQRINFTAGNLEVPDFGSSPLLAGCQAATSPALRPRNILRTEFAVVADKVDEFGIDNFTLTGLTTVPLEVTIFPGEVTQFVELPPDAPTPAAASLEYKCTWQAGGQTVSIMVPQ